MTTMLPAVRLSQMALETVNLHFDRIRPLARILSPALTTACMVAGLRMDLAELCGSVLASLIDDLIAISRLPRTDFERTKRKQRILAVADEPAASAVKLAMAASPINGRAAVDHWDMVCERSEVGKLAWLLGLQTDGAWQYGRKVHKMQNS